MGKSKKRSIYLGKNDQFKRLSRTEAVNIVVELLKNNDREAYNLITLFGLTPEELLEAGAEYEVVKCLGNIFK